jgi:UDP-N-acetyl-D-mannosaminuronate dehydrogenase
MLSVAINNATPRRVVQRLRDLLAGSLTGRRILLLGLSYREGVGDTRHSPVQALHEAVSADGAQVAVHDPLVSYWRERNLQVPADIPSSAGLDAVVLSVPHQQYQTFDYAAWLGENRPLFLDTFNVLSSVQRRELRALGCRVESVGRGAGL